MRVGEAEAKKAERDKRDAQSRGGAADAQNNGVAERRRSNEVAPRMARRARARSASALRASNEASPRHLGLASALRASIEASPRHCGQNIKMSHNEHHIYDLRY